MNKIVHIVPSLSRGGAERFVVDLCNELSKRNEVFLISLSHNTEDSFQNEISENVRLISLGKKPGLDIKVMLKLFNIIKKISPHIVNSHINAFEYLIPSIIFRFINIRCKFFHTIHNEADKEVSSQLIFFIRKRLFSLKLVTPITISKTMSKSFQEVYNLYGYDRQVDNGRPYREFSTIKRDEIRERYIVNDQQLFVNVARVDGQKNQLNLVRAFKNLRLKGCNAVLLILGNASNEELYNEIIAEIQDECNIYLLGGVSNVEDYLAACDAFILPSIYEGMPISLIEALSHGCVPICSPVGGMVDMIDDGLNGFLTQGVLSEDISNAIMRFLHNEDKEMIKINAKRSFYDRYSIEKTSLNYLNAYEI